MKLPASFVFSDGEAIVSIMEVASFRVVPNDEIGLLAFENQVWPQLRDQRCGVFADPSKVVPSFVDRMLGSVPDVQLPAKSRTQPINDSFVRVGYLYEGQKASGPGCQCDSSLSIHDPGRVRQLTLGHR
jgi:hypothetical protein